MRASWAPILIALCSLTSVSEAITIQVDDPIDVPNFFGYTVRWEAVPTAPNPVVQTVLTDVKYLDPYGAAWSLSLSISAWEEDVFEKGVYLGRRLFSGIQYDGDATPNPHFRLGEGVGFFLPAGSNGAFDHAQYSIIGTAMEWGLSGQITPTADGLGAHIQYRMMPPLPFVHAPDTGRTAALLSLGLLSCLFVGVRRPGH